MKLSRHRPRQFPRDLFWGSVLLLVMVLSSLAAPIISPFDPFDQRAGPPIAPASFSHLLGTDELGRDVLSRVLHGGRVVMVVASVAVAFALVLGSLLGIVAGYLGGVVDGILSRLIDILLSIPVMLLGISIVVIMGPGRRTLVVAIAVSQIPVFMRLTRSVALRLREEVFVQASRASGAGAFHIVRRHFLPNMAPILTVQSTASLGVAILATTALNFLGFGVQPPAADWGALVADYQRFVFTRWWLPIAPGASIVATVLAVSLIGDGISERLGIKSRGLAVDSMR